MAPMGTSTAHRSPATPEWERVRELYRAGSHDAAEISRRIVQALGPRTRGEMTGAGPTLCLETLLSAADAQARGLEAGPLAGCSRLLEAAARLRQAAEARIALGGYGSVFSDLALDALGSTAVRALGPSATSPFLPDLTGASWLLREARFTPQHAADLTHGFLAEDTERCFRHFVTRDLPDFIGTPALPTVAAARELCDAVAGHCRNLVDSMTLDNHADRLAQALQEVRSEGRMAHLGEVLTSSMDEGLRRVLDWG